MHSVTGKVTNLVINNVGWQDTAQQVGVDVTVQLAIPYIKMKDGKGNNATHYSNISMFYPLSETPPSIGTELTLSVEVIEPDSE